MKERLDNIVQMRTESALMMATPRGIESPTEGDFEAKVLSPTARRNSLRRTPSLKSPLKH